MGAKLTDVLMPKVSEAMREGTIVEWMWEDGDVVTVGVPLAEIETDKTSFEIEAEAAGVLEIVVDEGGTVDSGTLIAKIRDEVGASMDPTAG
jgi:pyruvate/2-oxoglutarate dehydrogenase complex dihydrolipoamide acyltransferase (E2) component